MKIQFAVILCLLIASQASAMRLSKAALKLFKSHQNGWSVPDKDPWCRDRIAFEDEEQENHNALIENQEVFADQLEDAGYDFDAEELEDEEEARRLEKRASHKKSKKIAKAAKKHHRRY